MNTKILNLYSNTTWARIVFIVLQISKDPKKNKKKKNLSNKNIRTQANQQLSHKNQKTLRVHKSRHKNHIKQQPKTNKKK